MFDCFTPFVGTSDENHLRSTSAAAALKKVSATKSELNNLREDRQLWGVGVLFWFRLANGGGYITSTYTMCVFGYLIVFVHTRAGNWTLNYSSHILKEVSCICAPIIINNSNWKYMQNKCIYYVFVYPTARHQK